MPEKPKTNSMTEKAGLTFNVNPFREGIITYHRNRNLTIPKVNKAHVVLAATLEKLCHLVVNEALKHVKKDKTGLKTITRPVLKYAVMLNKDLDTYYHMHLKLFNPDQDYLAQLPVTRKTLRYFLDNKVGKNHRLTNKASNLLNYLLMTLYIDTLRVAHDLLAFSGKKKINKPTVKSALRVLLKDSALCASLTEEINRAFSAVEGEKDEGEEGEEDENEDDDDDEKDEDSSSDVDEESDDEVEEVKTKAKSSKQKTKGKKKTEPLEQSSDEDNDEDDDADSDEDDAEDDAEDDEGEDDAEDDEGDDDEDAEKTEPKKVVAKKTKKKDGDNSPAKASGKGKVKGKGKKPKAKNA